MPIEPSKRKSLDLLREHRKASISDMKYFRNRGMPKKELLEKLAAIRKARTPMLRHLAKNK